ncbi:ODF3A protein, partial [Caloenas nicobarica]|nr:ODF3A protein [Caloenas nicobarica]
GPGTYTLPRVLGPNTAHTSASPCYSMKSRSQRDRYDADLAKTPGPAALPKIDLDVFKTRAPGYSMGSRTQLRDKTVKPGPADYRTGRVRQPPSAPARL